jgi:transposase
MSKIIRIGIDTSKSVFQLHGVDEAEKPVLRKKLSRKQMLDFLSKLLPLKVGLEACGASHHWARAIRALGHEAVLLPPQYVKPYVKRGKTDAADAEAICEAMSRPTMRFVTVKTPDEQAAQMLLGLRDQFVRRRTQLSNAIRGYAAEFGYVAAKGLSHLPQLLDDIRADEMLPDLALEMIEMLARDFERVDTEITTLDRKLMETHRSSEVSQRLAQMPGVGPVVGVMLSAKIGVAKDFRSGRDFAAWMGLTPKNHSTAGKNRLGVITRAGDERLRSVLVVGATAVINQWRRTGRTGWPWLENLIARKPPKLAAVALANKMARMAWKMMTSGETYRTPTGATPAAS